MKVDLLDINRRGDDNFDGLSEIEKDLYVLLLFVTLHEMEGLTHFFSYHLRHLPRLLAFLATVNAPNWPAVRDLAEFLKEKAGGVWDSDALDKFWSTINADDNAKINLWEKEYYSQVQEMWARTKEYLREQHGILVDE